MAPDSSSFGITITAREKGTPKKLTKDISGGLGDSVDPIEVAAYLKFSLINISREVLAEELGRGFNKEYVTLVDGKRAPRGSEERVKPFGKIQYKAPRPLVDVVLTTLDSIVRDSPRDTKLYLRNHYVIYNDRLLDASSRGALEAHIKKINFKKGDFIRIVNLTPYASMLEREGIVSGREKKRRRTLSRQKHLRQHKIKFRRPNGAYYLASKSAAKLFGGLYFTKFQWINGRYLGGAPFPLRSDRGKLRTTFAKQGGFYVYPSILIGLLR